MSKLYAFSGSMIDGFTANDKATLSWIRDNMQPDDTVVVIFYNDLQIANQGVSARRPFWERFAFCDDFLQNTFGDRFFVERARDRDQTVRETLKYIKEWYLADERIMISNCPEEEVKGWKFVYTGLPKISSSGEEKRY